MRTGKKGLTTHFELKQLAENAWAAIARDGGAAISNAGFVDLGGQVVVFDSFLTPQAARELEEAVEGLTGQKAGTVINSHHHNDHIWGNQVFAEHARILSSQRTREAITAGGMDEYRWFAKNAQQKLDEIQSQHDVAGDEKEREKVTLWLGYYRGLVEALPTSRCARQASPFPAGWRSTANDRGCN